MGHDGNCNKDGRRLEVGVVDGCVVAALSAMAGKVASKMTRTKHNTGGRMKERMTQE